MRPFPIIKLFVENHQGLGFSPTALTVNDHLMPCTRVEVNWDIDAKKNELVMHIPMSRVAVVLEGSEDAIQTQPEEQETGSKEK